MRVSVDAGSSITTAVISAQRDITSTACPGDAAYRLLGSWRTRIHATRLMRDDPGLLKHAVRLSVTLD